MNDFDTTVTEIHQRLIADVNDAMEHAGTPFNRDPSTKVQKALDEAKAALYKAIDQYVIGDNVTQTERHWSDERADWCGHGDYKMGNVCICEQLNGLKASQRAILKGEKE